MATTKTPARKAPAKAAPKSAAQHSNSSPKPKPKQAEVQALPSDESADQLQQEQDKLQQEARVSKADADFIDPEPGYDKDQVEHMREYYGLD